METITEYKNGICDHGGRYNVINVFASVKPDTVGVKYPGFKSTECSTPLATKHTFYLRKACGQGIILIG